MTLGGGTTNMPYAQRDGSGDIVGLFAQLQPGIAEEFVPANTTITEKTPARIARQFEALVRNLSNSEEDAVAPVLSDIKAYILEGKENRAVNLVQAIGAAPVLSTATRDILLAKIRELP